VVTVYLFFIFFFIALISLIIPPIIYETASLIRSLPLYLQDAAPDLNNYIDYSDVTRYLPNVTNDLLGIVTGVFSNALFVVTTLFFGLYFLLEENMFHDFLKRYFDEDKVERVTAVLHTAESRMSSWFWGELTLMTVVGVLTFIGLNLIGIRYALPLAVLAGLLEVVPNIGPIISSIPAILIGFGTSYFTGFSAMALYVVVQQLENSLIVPIIMRKAVGINPILTLIGGILGVLLAIPLFLFIETIITEVMKARASAAKVR
jgi:predicted PurR-regulated permease PerM